MALKLKLASIGIIEDVNAPVPASALECNAATLFITPAESNIGVMFIGDSSVSSTSGVPIKKGQPFVIDAPNEELLCMHSIFICGTNVGDTFSVGYLQEEQV